MRLLNKIIIKLILKKLAKKFAGNLVIIFPDDSRYILGENNKAPKFKISNYFLFLRILFSGTSGIGYGYSKGEWSTNNLSYIIELGIKNLVNIKSLKMNINFFLRIKKIFSLFFSNTISKSKRQISFHYDLGNNFYKCWLDKTMTYSSAIFSKKKQSLQIAQKNKYESLVRLANIKKNNTVLEIGCGWGGFVSYVSENIGSKITGITISRNQYDYVKKLKKNNAKVKFLDYRKVDTVYDKIISIEMFEAVGKKNWNKYFNILNKSLDRKGSIALQIITINENLYKSYENNKDFIQKYIFPGGMLPTKNIIYNLAKKNNLRIFKEISLRNHYVKTLNIWRVNFLNNWHKLEKLGYSDDFKRLWEYYLIYCEKGFKANTINVYQFLLKKSL